MPDAWAEWDARKAGVGGWEPIRPLSDERRAEYDRRNNPTGKVLPAGWTWDRKGRVYLFCEGDLNIRIAVSDDFQSVHWNRGTFKGHAHGDGVEPERLAAYIRETEAFVKSCVRSWDADLAKKSSPDPEKKEGDSAVGG